MAQKPAYGTRVVIVVNAHLNADERRHADCAAEFLRSKHILELLTSYSVLRFSGLFFAIGTVLLTKLFVSLIALFGFFDKASLTKRTAVDAFTTVLREIMPPLALNTALWACRPPRYYRQSRLTFH